MTILDAFILGIVEGITEFLPISSTGHLILASKLLGIPPSDFLASFEIAIQLGAILAVVAAYFKLAFRDFEIIKKVLVAFLPTAVIGFVLYQFIKDVLLGNERVVLWALFVGGIILIFFEFFMRGKESNTKEMKNMTYAQSFFIGIFQSLAVIPGVSRSAATIVGGLMQGIDRKVIVEFSFLLAVPTLASATFLDVLKSYEVFKIEEIHLLGVGFITAGIVAYLSINWLLSFIKTHTFIVFGVYRIVIAVVLGMILF